jgi:hypothetical protein
MLEVKNLVGKEIQSKKLLQVSNGRRASYSLFLSTTIYFSLLAWEMLTLSKKTRFVPTRIIEIGCP